MSLMPVVSSIIKNGQNIYIRMQKFLVSSDERKIKTGSEDSLWNPSLENRFGKEGEWLINNGERRLYARIGVSIGLFCQKGDKTAIVLSQFDDQHPTRPNQWAPPSAFYTSLGSPYLQIFALKNLAEEVILLTNEGVAFFDYKGQILAFDSVRKFVKQNNLLESSKSVKVIPFVVENNPDIFHIFLDGIFQGDALIACEADSGSLELIWLMEFNMTGIKLLDGEMFNFKYLNRPVGAFTVDEIVNKELSTKAGILKKLLESL